MSISKDVNLDLLNKCFELGPFHGLRVPHQDDIMQPLLSEPDIADDDIDVDDAEAEELEEGKDTAVLLYWITTSLCSG